MLIPLMIVTTLSWLKQLQSSQHNLGYWIFHVIVVILPGNTCSYLSYIWFSAEANQLYTNGCEKVGRRQMPSLLPTSMFFWIYLMLVAFNGVYIDKFICHLVVT